MILFLLKGLLRDRSRSLLPLLIVIGGVSSTVVLYSYITGIQNEMIWVHASLNTGHVRIMSKAYAEEVDQIPNDLALMNVSELLDDLKSNHPKFIWTPRIKFAGMLDIPDEHLVKAKSIGVIDVIEKPADLNLLMQILKNLKS